MRESHQYQVKDSIKSHQSLTKFLVSTHLLFVMQIIQYLLIKKMETPLLTVLNHNLTGLFHKKVKQKCINQYLIILANVMNFTNKVNMQNVKKYQS